MRISKLFSIILLIFIASEFHSLAQTGGRSTFEFLNLPASARASALGSNLLSISDNDISLVYTNPSLINPELNNNLSLSFVDYYSDISYGYATYARSFSKTGTFAGTVQYINYGTFTQADPTGQQQGTFTASEVALNLGWGRQLDTNFTIGANIKGIYSSFETYNASGLAVDVAGSWIIPEERISLSLIARNIGLQLTTYRPGDREPLPFDLTLAFSKRLEHVPLRFSVLLTNLHKWDLTFEDPLLVKTDPLTGQQKKVSGLKGFPDKVMRHVVLGAEFQPVRALSLRLGYNYQRRQQLKVESSMSTVGFSWGIGLQIKKFQFNYARSNDHLAGTPNYISIVTNLSTIF